MVWPGSPGRRNLSDGPTFPKTMHRPAHFISRFVWLGFMGVGIQDSIISYTPLGNFFMTALCNQRTTPASHGRDADHFTGRDVGGSDKTERVSETRAGAATSTDGRGFPRALARVPDGSLRAGHLHGIGVPV